MDLRDRARTRVSMRDRPIGVFDSGIGGLTVVGALQKILPQEEIVYFGDTAHVPYGTKSREIIKKFSLHNARFLMKFNIKLLIVACNSSSAVALPELKRRFSVPVLGVIEPIVEKTVQICRGKIGVIATPATIESGIYQRTIRKFSRRENKNVEISTQECPLFVPLAEEGWLENKISEQIAQRYLGFLKNKIDILILGCTHYPLLRKVIKKAVGKRVILIDSASETAKKAREILKERNLLAAYPPPRRSEVNKKGKIRFYVSDSPQRFKKLGKNFLQKGIGRVECIKLE